MLAPDRREETHPPDVRAEQDQAGADMTQTNHPLQLLSLLVLWIFAVAVTGTAVWGALFLPEPGGPLLATIAGIACITAFGYGILRLAMRMVGRGFRRSHPEDWNLIKWLCGWVAGVHDVVKQNDPDYTESFPQGGYWGFTSD